MVNTTHTTRPGETLEAKFAEAQTSYPKHLMIEITSRCNLKCVFCCRDEFEKNFGPGTFMEMDKLRNLESAIRHAENITVCGFGEPFLHPKFQDMLSYIYSINPKDNLINVVTNGLALTKKRASWFTGHLNTLSISLNASTAETYWREMFPHEYKAGKDKRETFHKLLARIKASVHGLKPEERHKVHLHYVVSRDNLEGVPGFVQLAHELGLSFVAFTHQMVHYEKHIGRSVYWIRDEYNDAIDEAIEIGRRLGVQVSARKFFSEKPKNFFPERDCTWPIDTLIIHTNGQARPCCYWDFGDNLISGNVFEGGPHSFESVWFNENYERLRKKRIGKSCKTCNILRTFDDVILHLSPFLKRQPEFQERLAAMQLESGDDVVERFKEFDILGLDFLFHRRVCTRLGIKKLCEITQAGVDKLEVLIYESWRKSLETQPSLMENRVNINLFEYFPGVGWGESGYNQHGQSWRWLGGHGAQSSILLKVNSEGNYRIKAYIHTAKNTHYLYTITCTVNGMEISNQEFYVEDGIHIFAGNIPASIVSENKGYLSIGFSAGDPAKKKLGERGLAFSHITVEEVNIATFLFTNFLVTYRKVKTFLYRLKSFLYRKLKR